MKKIGWIGGILLCLAVVVGAKPHKVHYASQAVESLPAFHTLKVEGNVEVDFRQHETATVHVSGPQNLVNTVAVEVQEGVLWVHFSPQGILGRMDKLRVAVTGPDLYAVIATGRSRVHVRGSLQTPKLTLHANQAGEFSADGVTVQRLEVSAKDQAEVDLNRLDAQTVYATASDKADIEMAGLALRATLDNRGAGEIDAADLRVHTGRAQVGGKGNIHISAYESLDAQVWGKGKIIYRGEPVVLNQSGNRKHIVPDRED